MQFITTFLKSRWLSSSLLLAIAHACELILPLLRGVILARILVPEQFGLALSVTLVASTLEIVSDLGIAQQALRCEGISDLATLHSLAIARGSLLTGLILLGGPLSAHLFGVPGAAWTYSLVGLASMIRSFSHLEVRLQMRSYRYSSEALINLGNQTVWTVVSLSAAYLLRDYRAMAIGFVAASLASAIISHLCSEAPYQLAWDRAIIARSWQFGRALTANGVALAISSVGDRFVIGAQIGLEALAEYTTLATAAFLPRSIITKFAITLFVPQFLNVHTGKERQQLADAWVVILSTMGGLFGLLFMGFGQTLIRVVFGGRYQVDQLSISLVSCLTAVRYFATIPVAPSLADGRTSFILYGTTLTSSGLVIASLLLITFKSLHVMLGAMLVGESLSLLWILYKMRTHSFGLGVVFWTAVLFPSGLLGFAAFWLGMPYAADAQLRYGVLLCAAVGICLNNVALLRWSHSSYVLIFNYLLPRRRAQYNSGS